MLEANSSQLKANLPELPEVHTTVTHLNRLISGLVISDVWTDYFSPVYKGKPQIKNEKYFELFKKDVAGAKIISVTRRAKNILINLRNPKAKLGQSKKTILIHMKMTGHLLFGQYQKVDAISNSGINKKWKNEIWIPNEKENSPLWDPFNRFVHLVFSFSNPKAKLGHIGTHLALSDVRKFAKVTLENTEGIMETKHLHTLGPEPLEKTFTFKKFSERLFLKPEGKIKQVLMDQTIISGIGNIYSDEILWRGGVHPTEKVKNIPLTKIRPLFKALKHTLSKGIRLGGDSTSDYRDPSGNPGKFHGKHMAYQRKNVPCLKKGCGGIMKRIIVGGRSAHFCDIHQELFSK